MERLIELLPGIDYDLCVLTGDIAAGHSGRSRQRWKAWGEYAPT